VHFRSMAYGQGSNSALPIWGGFMKKVYGNSKYKNLKKAQFTPPADSVLAWMQCPPYLEEMPYWDDYWDDIFEPSFWEKIFGKKKYKEGEEFYEFEDGEYKRFLKDKQRQLDSIKIIRRQQRLEKKDERRQKRKEFWSDKLFKNKKKER